MHCILVLLAGSVVDIPWTDVRVGDVIVVRDNELFPADLMCLYSSLEERVCFIKTTNLDGETNLKIKKPLDLKGLSVSPCRLSYASCSAVSAPLHTSGL